MNSVTLKPGSWPPSPGLAPWAILISSSRQRFSYSAVTPKPLVDGMFQRRNGLLFAYGMTNAGKTYTIQGSRRRLNVCGR